MALKWICGVSAYDDLTERWDAASNMEISTATPRRAGGKSIVTAFGATGYVLSPALLSTLSRAVIGVAFYLDNLNCRGDLCIGQSGSTEQVTLSVGNQSVTLRRGNSGGTVLETASDAFTQGAWHYLELDVTVANSGSWTVRIDGTTVLSGAGDTQALATSSIDYFTLGGASDNAARVRFCDIYVDTDTLRGDCIVQTIFPTGAGAATQFIPSTGANWENVDDLIDGDTTYNSATGSLIQDLFTFGDLPSIPGSTILGVGVNAVLRKDDTATRTAYLLTRTGTTTYNQNAGAVTSSYVNYQKIWETNPGGGAWTEAGVNGAQFGYMQYGVS